MSSSFDIWRQQLESEDFDGEDEQTEPEEPEKEIPPLVEPPRLNETAEQIKKLCRVCSSNGLISIHTTMKEVTLNKTTLKKIGEWYDTIGDIIAQVSGTVVSATDSLPQFICQHCLLYLQHAYSMRLMIIRNTDNLKASLEIADDNSIGLEAAQIDQKRITKREIRETHDDAIEEEHLFRKFQGTSIKITPNVVKATARAIEHKCPSCQKRVLSITSLNDHMDSCEISVLDTFFTSFKNIYSRRILSSLTTKEFILHAIRLVFDTYKKLQKIVKAKKLDVNAISSYIPLEPPTVTTTVNQAARLHHSPDAGYNSGPK